MSYKLELITYAFGQTNADLERIFKWSVVYGLKLNSDKRTDRVQTCDPELTVKNSEVSFSLDGGSVAICDRAMTVGVVFDRISHSQITTYIPVNEL